MAVTHRDPFVMAEIARLNAVQTAQACAQATRQWLSVDWPIIRPHQTNELQISSFFCLFRIASVVHSGSDRN